MLMKRINNKNRKDDIKLLCLLILSFIFIIWLCTPPGNKFAQACFWGNNTKLFVAKLFNNTEVKEYLIHRNNAVYQVKMNNKQAALAEIDKAIVLAPSYLNNNAFNNLYKDRAEIRLFYGDYKGALNDFLRIQNQDFMTTLKIGLLYRELGNYKVAASYCNNAILMDSATYVGFACLADIYAKHNKYRISVSLFDLLIDRVKNNPYYYYERASYKKIVGDIEGYNADMAQAKELLPSIKSKSSAMENLIKPKTLSLSII